VQGLSEAVWDRITATPSASARRVKSLSEVGCRVQGLAEASGPNPCPGAVLSVAGQHQEVPPKEEGKRCREGVSPFKTLASGSSNQVRYSVVARADP
jgi:hypothetical protein